MSKAVEPKRVNLTTISTMSSSSNLPGNIAAAASVRIGSDMFVAPQTEVASGSTGDSKRQKAIRLSLELSPTDKVNYPEINYARLMRLEEKKRKKLRQKTNVPATTAMPFEENDDDVARIAAELEKKYGSAYGRGRGRSKRDDHCDIGMGYDESDSFIDNTEAYDEIIPEEVETIEGGFYINCGALEFKQLHTETVKLKTDEIIKMPKRSKKRVLSTSSSEDSSSSDDENTARNREAVPVGNYDEVKTNENDAENLGESSTQLNENTAKIKSNDFPERKKHKKDKNSAAPKKFEQANGKKKEKSQPLGLSFPASASCSPKPAVAHEIEVASDSSEKDRAIARQKTVKTTTVKDMLKAKRDNFLKMQVVGASETAKSVNGELRGSASKSSGEDSSDDSDDDSESDTDSNRSAPQNKSKANKKSNAVSNTEENADNLRSTDTNLPELDVEVVTHLQTFKEIVKSKNSTGKRFQFDEQLTEVFLKIDESLLCIDKAHRNMVFAHLEFSLLLPKYFLLRKAKQLRIKEEKLKTQRALAKLRKAVIEAMPGVIVNYELEVRKCTDLQNANGNANPAPKMPKKKFPWNSNIRNLLYDVYQTRWTSFPVLCTRKESLEDFIMTYLKEKVVEIWPNGWMRYEELQKEIEKRKQASKKSKEKKLSIENNPNSSSMAGITAAATAASTAVTINAYARQFEDFATSRSCANSDTESVASSNASNGSALKRKATGDELNNKVVKNKLLKLNANGTAVTGGNVPSMNVALTSSSAMAADSSLLAARKTDFNTNAATIISAASTLTPYTLGSVSAVSNQVPDKNFKHSSVASASASSSSSVSKTTAHIIDLDQYNSANDILEKSKQLQKSTVTTSTFNSALAQPQLVPAPIHKRTSSSESDGVEIVGIFPAKPNATSVPKPPRSKKHQQQVLNATNAAAVFHNNNNNSKKSMTTAMTSVKLDGIATGGTAAFDINKAVNVLKEYERTQPTKPKNSPIAVKDSNQ